MEEGEKGEGYEERRYRRRGSGGGVRGGSACFSQLIKLLFICSSWCLIADILAFFFSSMWDWFNAITKNKLIKLCHKNP